MESPYYSKEFGPIVCTVCAQQLGNTRLERFREDSKHFAQVLPTCSDDCGNWKTSYPRKKGGAKRRAAAGDQSILYAKVYLDVDLYVDISEGNKFYIDNIVISGLESINKKLLI